MQWYIHIDVLIYHIYSFYDKTTIKPLCTICVLSLKPLCTLYKKAVKVLDKKPRNYHHYHYKKYNLLTFDMCLMYKLIHDLAPPPVKKCVSFCRDNVRVSRASVRGDCYTQFRKTKFGQSAFSFTVVEK